MIMTRLRTASWLLTVTESDGTTPIDLSGKTLWFFAKERLSDPDNRAAVRKNSSTIGGIVVTDSSNGLATLTIDPADTNGLPLKTSIVLLCESILVDGPNRYELDAGQLTVLGNVGVPS